MRTGFGILVAIATSIAFGFGAAWAQNKPFAQAPSRPPVQSAARPAAGVKTVAKTAPVALPAGLPADWDKNMPLPPGASVAEIPQTSGGVVREVQFNVSQDYQALVAFYSTALKKAGYNVGTSLKLPARKTYNVTFTKKGAQDSVSIFPAAKDPAKLQLKVVYSVEAPKTAQKAAPGSSAVPRMMGY